VNLRVCQSVEMAFDVPRFIARVNDKANAAEFELLGYEVMSLAKVAVTLLDGAEVTPGLLRLLQEKEAGESVAEVTIVSPVNVGRKLASLRLSGCDLVALRQDGAFSRVDELTTIGFGDVLTLFGSTKAIETAREQVNPPC
jgi:Trk K+ transport system NAD-binding subunit